MAVQRSPIKYALSGSLSIAYQIFGDGPTNIVIVPGFISNLEMMPESMTFGPLIERLGSIGRCVLFDKRGTGLSDREPGFGSLEERSDDIRAVMDEVGFEKASIVGYSEGGPLSVVFAASHAQRVDALALYGTFKRLPGAGGMGRLIEEVTKAWGTGHALRPFIQGIPDTDSATHLMARYERGAASPGVASAILRASGDIDVGGFLPSVKARTLVLHSSNDPLIPVEQGRQLADGITGAQFVEGDAAYHFTWDGTRLWWIDPVLEFFSGGSIRPIDSQRFLGTVLFTDIIGSTEIASSRGDRDWTQLLERHDRVAQDILDRFGGKLIKTTGDGLLALFDRPSQAVSAAHALRRESESLGLDIRAGVHTGEVEQRLDDLGGIALHIGARVMNEARDGEIWVSRTVRDLTMGSGIEYSSEGSYVLKGVSGEWDLYSSAIPESGVPVVGGSWGNGRS